MDDDTCTAANMKAWPRRGVFQSSTPLLALPFQVAMKRRCQEAIFSTYCGFISCSASSRTALLQQVEIDSGPALWWNSSRTVGGVFITANDLNSCLLGKSWEIKTSCGQEPERWQSETCVQIMAPNRMQWLLFAPQFFHICCSWSLVAKQSVILDWNRLLKVN